MPIIALPNKITNFKCLHFKNYKKKTFMLFTVKLILSSSSGPCSTNSMVTKLAKIMIKQDNFLRYGQQNKNNGSRKLNKGLNSKFPEHGQKA